MLVFYMLCMKDKNELHEDIDIELALSAVFIFIGEIKSSTMVIDKYKIVIELYKQGYFQLNSLLEFYECHNNSNFMNCKRNFPLSFLCDEGL